MTTTTVDLAEIKAKRLISIPDLRKKLQVTENLAQLEFATDGESMVEFDFPDDWAESSGVDKRSPGLTPTNVTLEINGQKFSMTAGAVFDASSRVKMPKDYNLATPGSLVADHLNYHYSHRPGSLKLLYSASKDPEAPHTGLSVTSATLQPFSNIELLDRALAAFGEHLSISDPEHEVFADYKTEHSLAATHFRLISPDEAMTVSGQPWSRGVGVENSINGAKPLTAHGYGFSWICTNGATITHGTGTHRRKQNEDVADVYDWFEVTVGECLADMEPWLQSVKALAGMELDDLSEVTSLLIEGFKVPVPFRKPILDELLDSDDHSAYGVMAAFTQAANLEDADPAHVQKMLSIGGQLPKSLAQRCEKCHAIPVGTHAVKHAHD